MPSGRFKVPDTALILAAIVVAAAALTWIVPPGAYERSAITIPGVGTREMVVPNTFRTLEREDADLAGRLLHSTGMIFKAPILGLTDPEAAPIVAFVLLIGGTFGVLQRTGAIDAALRRLVQVSRRSPTLELLLLPLFLTLFSLGGAVFGMAEETVPFVLIFVPLALALGYDSITGAAIPFVGASAGFAAAFFNPFTVGVAQGIAGVPPFSGAGFRVGLWLVCTAVTIVFVTWHAHRVRRDPTRSPTNTIDKAKRLEGLQVTDAEVSFTRRQQAVLAVFLLGMVVLVWGVFPEAQGGFGWYIVEIAALFVALGVVTGAVGGLGGNGTAAAFMDGVRQLASTAVLIGLARGILIVLEDGKVIDTILHAMASALEGTTATTAAMAMFAVQTAINFFVVSGSGQAALTMPLMAPLADLVGVTRQTAIVAYQMGDGFTNMIIPTNPVLMGVITLAGISWTQWARWLLPLQILLFVVGLIALVVAVSLGYGK
jgi:uncharacterized ion transporter superfamily protein YfcC